MARSNDWTGLLENWLDAAEPGYLERYVCRMEAAGFTFGTGPRICFRLEREAGVGMSINVSQRIEMRITEEAQRQGISVEALLEQLINDCAPSERPSGLHSPDLPVLHLGPMSPLRRRDIYDDVR